MEPTKFSKPFSMRTISEEKSAVDEALIIW